MNDANRQIVALSRKIATLERRLGELAGELAEMKHILGPLLGRYRREVLRYHQQLVETQRQIADLHLLLGDRGARAAADAETPLSSLVALEEYASVQEQYERVWRGKRPPRPEDIWEAANLPPAQEEIRALYAEIIAAAHPALAESPQDYARRVQTFSRANRAYVARNRPALGALAADSRPDSNLPVVIDEGEVRKLRARAAALEQLILQLEGQTYDLRHGDVAKVMAYAQAAERQGIDLIGQLGEDLRRELDHATDELNRLKARAGK
jgi:hypothetical protein